MIEAGTVLLLVAGEVGCPVRERLPDARIASIKGNHCGKSVLHPFEFVRAIINEDEVLFFEVEFPNDGGHIGWFRGPIDARRHEVVELEGGAREVDIFRVVFGIDGEQDAAITELLQCGLAIDEMLDWAVADNPVPECVIEIADHHFLGDEEGCRCQRLAIGAVCQLKAQDAGVMQMTLIDHFSQGKIAGLQSQGFLVYEAKISGKGWIGKDLPNALANDWANLCTIPPRQKVFADADPKIEGLRKDGRVVDVNGAVEAFRKEAHGLADFLKNLIKDGEELRAGPEDRLPPDQLPVLGYKGVGEWAKKDDIEPGGIKCADFVAKYGLNSIVEIDRVHGNARCRTRASETGHHLAEQTVADEENS